MRKVIIQKKRKVDMDGCPVLENWKSNKCCLPPTGRTRKEDCFVKPGPEETFTKFMGQPNKTCGVRLNSKV